VLGPCPGAGGGEMGELGFFLTGRCRRCNGGGGGARF
jgi:hypothetical protein